MELHLSDNGVTQSSSQSELRNPHTGATSFDLNESQSFIEDIDSSCSTPYVSAPSSPGHIHNTNNNNNGYFFSAPASPMHFILSSTPSTTASSTSVGPAFLSSSNELSGSFEFDFSARFSSSSSTGGGTAGSMISADELFLNGQIRPMKLSSHLQRPQVLSPLVDLEVEEDKDGDENNEYAMVRGRDLRLRSRSLHRRARSLSPLRNTPSPCQWHQALDHIENDERGDIEKKTDTLSTEEEAETETEATPCGSAASSRSSSSGRSSKRWEFLKDFLRSKSEGRGGVMKDKFWYNLPFSPIKDKRSSSSSSSSVANSLSSAAKEKTTSTKSKQNLSSSGKKLGPGKPANGVSKRRVPPSPHELHYTAKRAQAEEMKKKTFLPYRQGLLGCLGFSSKGYGAMNGLARSLNPVSTR